MTSSRRSIRQDYLDRHHSSRKPGQWGTELRLLALFGFRLFGTLTASSRRLPDFLLIGGKRCGSTTLQTHLLDSPAIPPLFPSRRLLTRWLKKEETKGVHYFDAFYDRGEAWYRSHFPTELTLRRYRRRTGTVCVGESSPYYLFHESAPSRVAELLPEAKLVVILRDPVVRAWSHYREQVKRGNEPLETFEEALEAEADRLSGTWSLDNENPTSADYAAEHFAYRRQGEYATALLRWLQHFSREQLLILFSEQLFAQPAATLSSVSAFLGVPTSPPKQHWRNAAPVSVPLSADTRTELQRHYKPHNQKLESILGSSLPW